MDITRMSNANPAAAANQAMKANQTLKNIPPGVAPVNNAMKANQAVINGAKTVVQAQVQATNAAAEGIANPTKANASQVQLALNKVNKAMKNLAKLKNNAAMANKNVVNAILKSNNASKPNQ